METESPQNFKPPAESKPPESPQIAEASENPQISEVTFPPHLSPQAAVDRVFGAGRAEAVDCVTTTKVTEEKSIFINGVKVNLTGRDGEEFEKAVMEGRMPDRALLDRVMEKDFGKKLSGTINTGQQCVTGDTVDGKLFSKSVDANVTLTSKVSTKDTLTLHHNGSVVDRRVAERDYDTVLEKTFTDSFQDTNKQSSGATYITSCPSPCSSPIPPARRNRKLSSSFSTEFDRYSSQRSRNIPDNRKSSSPDNVDSSDKLPSPTIPIRPNRASTSSGSSGIGLSSGCSSNGSPPLSVYAPRNSTSSADSTDCCSSDSTAVNTENGSVFSSVHSDIGSVFSTDHGTLRSCYRNPGNYHCSLDSYDETDQMYRARGGFGANGAPTLTKNIFPDLSTLPARYLRSSTPPFPLVITPTHTSSHQMEKDFTKIRLKRDNSFVKRPTETPVSSHDKSRLLNPTIFGTLAGDQSPKDNFKRGFPQTPKNAPQRGGSEVPEWGTLLDDDNSLVYEDNVLVSGSLSALIQHATPTPSYYPDTAYLFAFLLSSRLFIKPHELLSRVCQLGFRQQGIDLEANTVELDKENLKKFIEHVIHLLGEWTETFPYDFRDDRVMAIVRSMTHKCVTLLPTARRDVTQVLTNLLNKLTSLERYEETLLKHAVAPPADTLAQVPDITDVCSSALVMAQQLTHIELERLSYIGPEEFVQAFAKDSNIDSSYKDLKKTNNLEVYVQWFNKLSYLVATQAVSHVKKKQRVRVIEWWIEVARECFNIGNFNSLMGIIAGLNMSPVSRLKKTWSKVQSAKFSVLEHQMDPSSNFSSYRSTLKAAMWRSAGAVDDRQKIVIPFFSLLVKDLYFLNEGCANRLPNSYINFDKFWQLAKQVTEFMAWKQVSCPFEKDSPVINYLQGASVLSEKGLALSSFECESPDNSYEKERYKSLHHKTETPSTAS